MTAAPSPFDMTQWLPEGACRAFHAATRRIRYAQGELIYSQGDIGNAMYRLLSGAVRLSVARADGRELLYLLFQPGDCFGVSSLVDGGPLPQTAEAAEDIEMEVLSKTAFMTLRAQDRAFEDALLRLTTAHMRALSAFFANAHLEDLSARIAGRILAAAQGFGESTGDGISLTITLSQSELARMVGGSRQSVNKILQQFHREGLLGTTGGRLIIHSTAGLKAKLTPE
ncbi:Crp/Fnr family transcriptional regulator [Flavisphingomonas formosensis]|uniref:Crp/Fnr family transcriptional regulator n=1 Tax=Flavisphingomonas formosensis TaxID=861534 RepID=UPI0012FAA355|nr:Crp/Fnr family transcriptional regulator [Sphingomonas formosensis]